MNVAVQTATRVHHFFSMARSFCREDSLVHDRPRSEGFYHLPASWAASGSALQIGLSGPI